MFVFENLLETNSTHQFRQLAVSINLNYCFIVNDLRSNRLEVSCGMGGKLDFYYPRTYKIKTLFWPDSAKAVEKFCSGAPVCFLKL